MAFAVPAGCLLAAAALRARADDRRARGRARPAASVELSLVTPEQEPLELFGPAASDAVRRAARRARHRALTAAVYPADVRERRARARARPAQLPADRVVSLPRLRGPVLPGPARTTPTASSRPTCTGSCAGEHDVYAAGDATTCPIKQGGVATQQADAAAEAIAARAGAPTSSRAVPPGAARAAAHRGGAGAIMRAEVSGGRRRRPSSAVRARAVVAAEQDRRPLARPLPRAAPSRSYEASARRAGRRAPSLHARSSLGRAMPLTRG